MSSELVYISKITSIDPIENADRLESAEVICGSGGKWRGVVPKGDYNVGDECVVYLQDSIIPEDAIGLEFMEKYDWRVRMQKLRGARSEVLITGKVFRGEVGDDVTEIARVKKYNKPISPQLAGEVKGNFPVFIPRTDEPNFQVVPQMLEALRGEKFYSTVKCDGSSATVYWRDGVFGCCSRNLELKETEANAIWRLAREYEMEKAIMGVNIALQFEIVGPGVQKNPMGLDKLEPRLFNIYDMTERRYADFVSVASFSDAKNIPMVEVIEAGFDFNPHTEEWLQTYAEGLYPNGNEREGVVIRPIEEMEVLGERLSFKVINLLYKD